MRQKWTSLKISKQQRYPFRLLHTAGRVIDCLITYGGRLGALNSCRIWFHVRTDQSWYQWRYTACKYCDTYAHIHTSRSHELARVENGTNRQMKDRSCKKKEEKADWNRASWGQTSITKGLISQNLLSEWRGSECGSPPSRVVGDRFRPSLCNQTMDSKPAPMPCWPSDTKVLKDNH